MRELESASADTTSEMIGRPSLSRLRSGEWIVGIASLALLVVVFAAPWFGAGHASGSPDRIQQVTDNGWQSLSILGPVTVLVALLGLAVWWLQACCRAPALPVSATVLETLLSFALLIGLVVRVVFAHPAVLAAGRSDSSTHVKYGAWTGLALVVVVLAGSYRSLRTDGIAPPDGPQGIETVRLTTSAAGER
jgi:hypothetical protein